jgi:hypothetical protein
MQQIIAAVTIEQDYFTELLQIYLAHSCRKTILCTFLNGISTDYNGVKCKFIMIAYCAWKE